MTDGTAPCTELTDLNDLALLCHDLRQYVAAGLMLTQRPGDEELGEPVRRRLDSLEGLLQQISLMIESAELGASDADTTHLGPLVDDCAKVIQLARQATIEIDLDETATAPGSPTLLRRALTNLLDNAARAAGVTGHVRVRVSGTAHESVVEITDTGDGWGKIPTVNGHGLASVGLALRRCHGRLEIGSPSTGGTTVRVVFPSQQAGTGS